MSASPWQPTALDDQHRLKITEIFLSLQGEAHAAGWPCVFVRLTGCPLRCHYCDTAYAFHGGQWQAIADIVTQVVSYRVPHVCITGGEPLAQKRCALLLHLLCEAGLDVSLETSGALDISGLDDRVVRVVDIKTPNSGEVQRNRWDNLSVLTARDQLKIVICSVDDYQWAKALVFERNLAQRCTVWFSPSQTELDPRDLADWIVRDRLPVRLQLQLHKILWGNQPGY